MPKIPTKMEEGIQRLPIRLNKGEVSISIPLTRGRRIEVACIRVGDTWAIQRDYDEDDYQPIQGNGKIWLVLHVVSGQTAGSTEYSKKNALSVINLYERLATAVTGGGWSVFYNLEKKRLTDHPLVRMVAKVMRASSIYGQTSRDSIEAARLECDAQIAAWVRDQLFQPAATTETVEVQDA